MNKLFTPPAAEVRREVIVRPVHPQVAPGADPGDAGTDDHDVVVVVGL